MRIGGITASLVAAVSLLASCGFMKLPGDSKVSSAKRTIVSSIQQTEKQLYQCVSSPTIRNTRFDHFLDNEAIEEWAVTSCTGDEHAYFVAYRALNSGAVVYHENKGKSGTVTQTLSVSNNYAYDDDFSDVTIQAFDRKIDVARMNVLNESPETEAMLQQGKGEQYGGKHLLTLCDTPMLNFEAQRIGLSVQKEKTVPPFKGFAVTHCYQWYGTRHDWKENVLKKGI
jgi:hypothetical protein